MNKLLGKEIFRRSSAKSVLKQSLASNVAAGPVKIFLENSI